MGQVTFAINGRSYRIGCADGEEDRLRLLAQDVSKRVDRLVLEFGQVGEARLLLMAALLASDALLDARADLEAIVAEGAEQLYRTAREGAEASLAANGGRMASGSPAAAPAVKTASLSSKDGEGEARNSATAGAALGPHGAESGHSATTNQAAPAPADAPSTGDAGPPPGKPVPPKPGRSHRIEIPGRVRSA